MLGLALPDPVDLQPYIQTEIQTDEQINSNDLHIFDTQFPADHHFAS